MFLMFCAFSVWGILNSCRAVSPLVMLVKGEERWEATPRVSFHKIGEGGSPPGGAKAYQLLHRLINRQVTNMVAKNDANLVLLPTSRYDFIESPLYSITPKRSSSCDGYYWFISISHRHTTPMPVIRRIGERTIPYSWRTCEQLRHFVGCVIHVKWLVSLRHVSDGLVAFCGG
ncbi:hypothetical protein TNCV_2311001 [Trichonephila clavipes]|nr:hypothetical protein TNCV_2311001 [Trichonephila clavipes]